MKRSLTRQTIASLFWMAAGRGATGFIEIVLLAVLARLITPGEFGIIGAALIVTRLLAGASRLGIGPALVQLPTLESRHIETAFAVSVGLGLAMGGVVWLGAPAAAAFFKVPQVEPVLRVLAWTFPLRGASIVAESLIQRTLQFRWLASLQFKSLAMGYAPAGIVLALAGFGVWALVAAHVAQALVRATLVLTVNPPPRRLWPERRAFGELAYFGGGFTLAKLANYLAQEGDYLIVGRWLGPVALGLYTRAYKLMGAPASLFAGMLDDVLFPTFARLQDDVQRLATGYRRGITLIALVMLPASAILAVLAPELVRVVLGSQWQGVVAPFQILAAGLLFRSSYKMSDSLVRAKGAVYHRAWRQAVYAALVIGGAWIGQHWDITGVAVGVLGALMVNFLLMAHLSLTQLRQTHEGLSWSGFWRAHVPAALLAAACGTITAAIAIPLRTWDVPSILIVPIVLAGTAGVAGVLLWRAPSVFLGADGTWMLETLRTYIPARLAGTRAPRPRRSAATQPDGSRHVASPG
jgi:PST family polysaccharide transporter